MKFTTRLVLCTVIPSSLFVLALDLALWSLVRTQHDFNRYIGVEQAVVTGLSEMYAQGLQSGQALRNILLDPANRTAYTNFDAAQSAFAQAHTATLASARGTAFEADVQALLVLRNHQFAAQQQVQALAQSDAAQAVSRLAQHTRNPGLAGTALGLAAAAGDRPHGRRHRQCRHPGAGQAHATAGRRLGPGGGSGRAGPYWGHAAHPAPRIGR